MDLFQSKEKKEVGAVHNIKFWQKLMAYRFLMYPPSQKHLLG